MIKKPHKFFYVLVFILVLIVFAVLGFLLAKWLKSKEPGLVTSTATVAATKSPEVANKTYSNEVYGFTFSYKLLDVTAKTFKLLP